VISSSPEILTEVSQFCACEQCSAGKIVLFADRRKVETLRSVFRHMLEQEGSNISIVVEPIEKLVGVIHVALAHQTENVDLSELSKISEGILRRSSVHAKVPCSRHRPTDMACAHGGVSALAFCFINAFVEDLKQLGVKTSNGKHFLQPKSVKEQPHGAPAKKPQKQQLLKNKPTSADSMAVVPGPVVFQPGRGRLRTVAKVVPWNECPNGDNETPENRGGLV